MRVVILGNSVALRVRPPRRAPEERTYAERLRLAGHDVSVVARAGTLLSEAYARLDDDVIARFPDVVIVNYGVVEVCYRHVVRRLQNGTIVNYYRNAVFARPYRFATRAGALGLTARRAVNGLVRRAAALLRLRWQWMPLPRFVEVLEATIDALLKDTGAHVVLLGINPCSARVELSLTGSTAAITAANDAMEQLARRHADRVSFVAPREYLAGASPEELVPDGVHFSAEGHRRVAEALQQRLRALEAA